MIGSSLTYILGKKRPYRYVHIALDEEGGLGLSVEVIGSDGRVER